MHMFDNIYDKSRNINWHVHRLCFLELITTHTIKCQTPIFRILKYVNKKWWSLPYIHVNKYFTGDIPVCISVPITAIQKRIMNFPKAATYLNDATYNVSHWLKFQKLPPKSKFNWCLSKIYFYDQ